MASQLIARLTHRLFLIGALAVLAALLVIPRAASQESRTLAFDVVIAGESMERIVALGNPTTDASFLSRGDSFSGQGAVYAAGDVGGERIGTFYYMAVATADPEHYEAVANHFYAVGHVELFGQGTLAVTSVVSYIGPSAIAITGGTGSYALASGQCAYTWTPEVDHWECEVQ